MHKLLLHNHSFIDLFRSHLAAQVRGELPVGVLLFSLGLILHLGLLVESAVELFESLSQGGKTGMSHDNFTISAWRGD